MSPRLISRGKCFLCGRTFAKNTMTRHLKSCLSKQEKGTGKPVRLFHMRVEGRYAPAYWLHLEIPASNTLADLDVFLRAIWLECCGHLSAFTVDNVSYELDTGMVDAMWKDFFGPAASQSMNVKLYRVLSVGKEFFHEYDFGTTTALKLKVLGERKGALPKGGIRLLARNYAPVYPCKVCDEPAAYLYMYGYPYEPYCNKHARKHDEWPDGFLPVVNSPRVGSCGYAGPNDETLKFEEIAPEKN